MAHSCPRLLLIALAFAGVAAAEQRPEPPAAPAAQPPAVPLLQEGGLPINLEAASSDVDYRTNTVEFRDVVISQGNTRVQAEHAHATGLNFVNSRWTFEGKVRIEAELHGNLRSDQATVEFRDNRIARATITGKPAEFEQQRAQSEQMARGHADEIVYDVSDGTVRLANEAWLSDGQNEISGPLLVYNVRAQRVQASAPSPDQRIHILIQPPHASPPAPTPKP